MPQEQEEIKQVTRFDVTTTVPGFITHAEIISALRAKYDGVTYDVSTPTGMAKAVFARKELREARVALDKRKPEVKREALDFCAKVEADYKAIRLAVSEYEDIPDAAIKAEEERKEAIKAEKDRIEAERVAALRARVTKIQGLPLLVVGMTAADLDLFIAKVRAQQIGPDFAELENEAEQARCEVLLKLEEVHAATVRAEEEAVRIKAEQEAEAARLEEIRVEQEKAAAVERDRLAAEKAENDRLQAARDEENRKEREELDRLRAADAAEVARKDGIRAKVDIIRNFWVTPSMTSKDVSAMIDTVEEIAITQDEYQEFFGQARDQQVSTVTALLQIHKERLATEAVAEGLASREAELLADQLKRDAEAAELKRQQDEADLAAKALPSGYSFIIKNAGKNRFVGIWLNEKDVEQYRTGEARETPAEALAMVEKFISGEGRV